MIYLSRKKGGRGKMSQERKVGVNNFWIKRRETVLK